MKKKKKSSLRKKPQGYHLQELGLGIAYAWAKRMCDY